MNSSPRPRKHALAVKRESDDYAVHAEYVAEMVRQMLFERYPEDVYTRGFRVYTTITQGGPGGRLRRAAPGLLDYDRRHGYRGPEGYVELERCAEAKRTTRKHCRITPTATTCSRRWCWRRTRSEVRAYRRGGEIVTHQRAKA